MHIVRNPYVIFPSTVNLWKRLYRNDGLQVPRYEGLEEHVLETFQRMYEVFERDRGLIPPANSAKSATKICWPSPLEQMRRIYAELQLGEFDAVQPAMAAYFANKSDYKTNRYDITPEQRAEIDRRRGASCSVTVTSTAENRGFVPNTPPFLPARILLGFLRYFSCGGMPLTGRRRARKVC